MVCALNYVESSGLNIFSYLSITFEKVQLALSTTLLHKPLKAIQGKFPIPQNAEVTWIALW